jgi:ABC-2 type transport system ATP-binding protein
MTDAVVTQGLGRVYQLHRRRRATTDAQRDVVALDGVNLSIPVGEIHGLLGPNGAGKTTLAKILSTILTPSSGSATVAGFDVVKQASEVRRSIGLVLGGDRGLYGGLTAVANLRFWASMYGMGGKPAAQRIEQVIDLVGLAEVDIPAERYSRGMAQRLHLARGLLPDPAVLLLDEPTTGMDPVSSTAFRDLVRRINAAGTTILLTTHDMAEAEALCHRVSMIDRGRILTTATPAALSQMLLRYERIDVGAVTDEQARDLAARFDGRDEIASAIVLDTGTVRLETKREGAVADLLTELIGMGHTSVTVGRPSLAEVYVHLIGDRGMRVR